MHQPSLLNFLLDDGILYPIVQGAKITDDAPAVVEDHLDILGAGVRAPGLLAAVDLALLRPRGFGGALELLGGH
jgi:hypothetical protein